MQSRRGILSGFSRLPLIAGGATLFGAPSAMADRDFLGAPKFAGSPLLNQDSLKNLTGYLYTALFGGGFAGLKAAWALGRKLILPFGDTVVVPNGETLTSWGQDVHIVARGVTWLKLGSAPVFVVGGGWEAIQAITAITINPTELRAGTGGTTGKAAVYDPTYDTVFSVQNPGLYKPGDVIKTVDRQNMPDDLEKYQGEFGVVRRVLSDGVQRTGLTRFSYDATKRCRVGRLNKAKIVFDFEGGQITEPEGFETISGRQPIVLIEAALAPELRGGHFRHFYAGGIQLMACYEASVSGMLFTDGLDNGEDPAVPYAANGVAFNNCEHALFFDNHGHRCRHLLTALAALGAGRFAGGSDALSLSAYGHSAYGRVFDCSATACTKSGFNTHQGSYAWTFSDITTTDSKRSGILLRGSGHTVDNHTSIRDRTSWNLKTQRMTDKTIGTTIRNSRSVDAMMSIVDAGPGCRDITLDGVTELKTESYKVANNPSFVFNEPTLITMIRVRMIWRHSRAGQGGLSLPIRLGTASGHDLRLNDCEIEVTDTKTAAVKAMVSDTTPAGGASVAIDGLRVRGGAALGALASWEVGLPGAGTRFSDIRGDGVFPLVRSISEAAALAYVKGPIYDDARSALLPDLQLVSGVWSLGDPVTIGVTSDVLAVTMGHVLAVGEGGAADSVTSITGGKVGDRIVIGHGGGATITVRHDPAKIALKGGADCDLSLSSYRISLLRVSPTLWIEEWRNTG